VVDVEDEVEGLVEVVEDEGEMRVDEVEGGAKVVAGGVAEGEDGCWVGGGRAGGLLEG
jgi:hypothetical protein